MHPVVTPLRLLVIVQVCLGLLYAMAKPLGDQGGRVSPLTTKNLPKIGKKREKTRKKREKSGRKRKIGKIVFSLPLLTDRAGYATDYTVEGQQVLATMFFLFTWVHLYKGGSVYIKYDPLSFIPCNMGSVARLVALWR